MELTSRSLAARSAICSTLCCVMTTKSKLDVKLEDLLESDLPIVAAGNWSAFPSFFAPLEPPEIRPPHEVRLRRGVARLRQLLHSPHTYCRKATLDGKLIGIALWHRPGAPIFNLKRRLAVEDGRAEGPEEEEMWEGVDLERWESVWGGWDNTRKELMKGQDHWYLAPLWVLPEYQGQGVGGKLLQEVCDLVDKGTSSEVACIYLEASPAGKPIYESRYNFQQIGTSEYVEMARFGPKKA